MKSHVGEVALIVQTFAEAPVDKEIPVVGPQFPVPPYSIGFEHA